MSEINKKVKIKQLEDRQEVDQIFINTRAQDVYVKDISELVVDKTRLDTVIPVLEPDNEQIPGNSENEDLVTFLRKTKYFTNRLGNSSSLNVNTLKSFKRYTLLDDVPDNWDSTTYNNPDVIYLCKTTDGYRCYKYFEGESDVYQTVDPVTEEIVSTPGEAFISFEDIKNSTVDIDLNQICISIYENTCTDSNIDDDQSIVFPSGRDTSITYDYIGRDVYLHIVRRAVDSSVYKYTIISIKYNTLNSNKTTIEYNVLANINKYLDDMFAGTEDIIELINSVTEYTTYEKIDKKPFEYYTGKSFNNIHVGDIFTVNHDTLGKCYCTVIGKYNNTTSVGEESYKEVIDNEPNKYITCLLLAYENDIRFPFNHFKSRNYPSGEQNPTEYEHNILKNYYPWSLIFQYMNSDEINWFNSPYTKINDIYINQMYRNMHTTYAGVNRILNEILPSTNISNRKFYKISVNSAINKLDIQSIKTDNSYHFDVETDITSKYAIKGFLKGFPKRFKDLLVRFNKLYSYSSVDKDMGEKQTKTLSDYGIDVSNINKNIVTKENDNNNYCGYVIDLYENIPAYMHLLSINEIYGYEGCTLSYNAANYKVPSYYRSELTTDTSYYPKQFKAGALTYNLYPLPLNNFNSFQHTPIQEETGRPAFPITIGTDMNYRALSIYNNRRILSISRFLYTGKDNVAYDYLDIVIGDSSGYAMTWSDAYTLRNKLCRNDSSNRTYISIGNEISGTGWSIMGLPIEVADNAAFGHAYGYENSTHTMMTVGPKDCAFWNQYPNRASGSTPVKPYDGEVYVHHIIPIIAINNYTVYHSGYKTFDVPDVYRDNYSPYLRFEYIVNGVDYAGINIYRQQAYIYKARSENKQLSLDINLNKPFYKIEGSQYPYFKDMTHTVVDDKVYDTAFYYINDGVKNILNEKYNKKTTPSGDYNENGRGVIETIPLRSNIDSILYNGSGYYNYGFLNTSSYNTYAHVNPVLYLKPNINNDLSFVVAASTPTNISLGDGYSSILGDGSDSMFENSIHPIFVLNADIDSN